MSFLSKLLYFSVSEFLFGMFLYFLFIHISIFFIHHYGPPPCLPLVIWTSFFFFNLNILKTLFSNFLSIVSAICPFSPVSVDFLPWNRDFFPPVSFHILYFFLKIFIIESSNGISLEIRLFEFSREFLLLLFILLIFLLFYDLFPRDLPGV